MRTRQIRRKKDRKPRNWHSDAAIEDVLIALAEDGHHYSAAQVHRQLVERFPNLNVPDVRTIRRHVDEVRADINDDDASEWHAEDEADFSEARAILDVWGAMLARRVRSSDNRSIAVLTNLEADWIIYATQLAPGLKPYATGLLSRLLMVRYLAGRDYQPLDILLAMAPWKSVEAHAAYIDALEAGRLPRIQFAEGLLYEIENNLAAEAKAKAKAAVPTQVAATVPTATAAPMDWSEEEPLETVAGLLEVVEKLLNQAPVSGPATPTAPDGPMLNQQPGRSPGSQPAYLPEVD
ncbi:MAG: hypothetical protein O3A93_13095 [Chloroflexi bacterium]|nr:hypothetical protein [Chloroflexota bacterium]MDA1272170.1 hypothetical protein [Chloroflexota bacterium]PKB59262.1 MAG: hypothetical protein BZY83_02695 [SAR202 cluster bacterium Casp-Chloro-G2]